MDQPSLASSPPASMRLLPPGGLGWLPLPASVHLLQPGGLGWPPLRH